MKALTFIAALTIAGCATFLASAVPIPKDAVGPAPTQTEVSSAVNRWVRNVKLARPDKLVIEGVRVTGPAAWKRDWNDNKLTGIGAGAFPQKQTYDYGWEIQFLATTTSQDGVITRKVKQSILLVTDNPPRIRQFVQ